jgi:rubrerythrin
MPESATKLDHPALVKLMQKAFSGERAAAFAYIGHAGSLKSAEAKAAVKQIEDDERGHGENLRLIMQLYGVSPSKFYEAYFYVVGRVISTSCSVIKGKRFFVTK